MHAGEVLLSFVTETLAIAGNSENPVSVDFLLFAYYN
jgi:hypothetical protein